MKRTLKLIDPDNGIIKQYIYQNTHLFTMKSSGIQCVFHGINLGYKYLLGFDWLQFWGWNRLFIGQKEKE
jgi:hypothetical protein